MDIQKFKEACRLYYICKGHLPPSLLRQEEHDGIIEHFSRRVWRMEEVYLREEGFEEAFKQFNKERVLNDIRTENGFSVREVVEDRREVEPA